MCRSNAVDLARGVSVLNNAMQPAAPILLLQLEALTAKYGALLALRVQREHLESNGVFALSGAAAAHRRRHARALAQRFAGALRELDCWSAAELAKKLHELADERARALHAPQTVHPKLPWVRAVMAYHTGMHAALHLRRLARAQHLEASPQTPRGQRFLAWYRERGMPEAQVVDATLLERFAPRRGRHVVALVCEDVAADMGCLPEVVRRYVFGASALA